jgi:hypothetical protein
MVSFEAEQFEQFLREAEQFINVMDKILNEFGPSGKTA